MMIKINKNRHIKTIPALMKNDTVTDYDKIIQLYKERLLGELRGWELALHYSDEEKTDSEFNVTSGKLAMIDKIREFIKGGE